MVYKSRAGIDDFAVKLSTATPLQLVETERHGAPVTLLKDIAGYLGMSPLRVFQMVGLKAVSLGSKHAGVVTGSAGQAAIRSVRLIARAKALVARSTAEGAETFNVGRWLGKWLELPQPALGGKRPADFLDTPTGSQLVERLLGAMESGSFQ